LIKAVKAGINSKEESLDDLKKLAKVMWLSVDVYEDVRRTFFKKKSKLL
jgi:hypothetical protein